MKIRRGGLRAALPVVLATVGWGCTDQVPTSSDGAGVPIDATTVEVRLPFSEFATDFQVFTGFGSAAELSPPVIAREWGGDVDAYALFRFGALPSQIFVFPPGETATEGDDDYAVVGGEIRLQLARDEGVGDGPFELEAAAIQTAWHPNSASWDLAVDTLDDQTAWGEPGGGPVESIGTMTWMPEAEPEEEENGNGDEEGDEDENGDEDEGPGPNTVVIQVDSATANRWVATGRRDRGLRVGALTPGSMIEITAIEFDAFARSEINPDTLVSVSPGATPVSTVIHSPEPDLSTETFRIGGAPASRATLRFDLPETVELDPALCEAIECPVELRPERFLYAGLELYSSAADPAGLRPLEERVVELRPVLSPDHLPRSPLAAPIACPSNQCAMVMDPTLVPSAAFAGDAGTRVDLPMTRHVRDLVRAVDPDRPQVPTTVAIVGGRHPVTGSEVRALTQLTFHGPGTELEPTLRLILTLSDELGLP